MGHLAEGALYENGEVIGIIPEFMYELEWGHPKISKLQVVEDMHIRKQKMIEGSDAVIALPGGSGTLLLVIQITRGIPTFSRMLTSGSKDGSEEITVNWFLGSMGLRHRIIRDHPTGNPCEPTV